MAIAITDDGSTLKIVDGTNIAYVSKDGLTISKSGDYIFIQENDGSNYKYLYTDVTTPSSASAAELAATLEGYMEGNTTSNTPSIKSSTTAAEANESRNGILIQNLGTNTLYVRWGSGASTSLFHAALKAGDANDDGKGGSIYKNKYTGIVTVAGTSPRYTTDEH